MPYLKDIEVQAKVGPVGPTSVHVSWTFDALDCDAVEVRYGDMPSLEAGVRAAIFPVVAKTPTDTTITMEAPFIGYIGVFPQKSDGQGGFLGTLPDDDGNERVWSELGLVQRIILRAVEPAPEGMGAPAFNAPEFQPGTVLLTWSTPAGADFFNLRFTRDGAAGETRPPRPGEILYRTHVGEHIAAQARGGLENVIGVDRWGPWSEELVFDVPAGQGYRALEAVEVYGIAAVARDEGRTVVVAADGVVRALDYSPPLGWHVWTQIPAPDAVRPGTAVTAISRSGSFVDAFIVIDERVHLAWWKNGSWHDLAPLSGPEFPALGHVGAASRDSDHMDIFAVNQAGIMRSCWWNGDPWRAWFDLPGATFPPGAPVAATCRNDDVQEIWAVDATGTLRGTWWDGTWHEWYQLGGATFPAGAWVAASSNGNDDMRVAAVDDAAVVREARWDGTWQQWLHRPGVDVDPGQPVALAAGNLWVVDQRGRLQRWVEQAGRWQVEREADPPLWNALAAVHDEAFAFARSGTLGRALSHPLQPGRQADWWKDG